MDLRDSAPGARAGSDGTAQLSGREVVSGLQWANRAALVIGAVLAGVGVATSGLGRTHLRTDVWLWAGDVTPTSFQLRVKGEGTLSVANSADPGTPAFSQLLSGTEVHSVVVSGLTPSTEYVYALDGLPDTGRVRTWSSDGVEATLRVATASCATTGSSHPVFEEIAAAKYDMFVHMGDMHYRDIEVNDISLYRDAFDEVHAVQRPLFLSTPVYYMWDDHDYGPDDSHMNSPGREAAMQCFKESVPHPSQGLDKAYYAFSVGRTRFVMMDTRSERIPGQQIMSETQLEWLLQEIRDPGDHKLLVLMLATPWVGAGEEGADGWRGHVDTRQVVSAAIAEALGNGGYDNVLGIAGDSHTSAFAHGSLTDYSGTGLAGFPLMQAGPLDRLGSCKGGPYSTPCYGTKLVANSQYGSMEITDDGGSDAGAVCVKFQLHRAGEGVLNDWSMCGPFLPQRDTTDAPVDEPMALFHTREYTLIAVSGVLFLVVCGLLRVLHRSKVPMQASFAPWAFVSLVAFACLQLGLIALGLTYWRPYSPGIAVHMWYIIAFEVVLLVPLSMLCLGCWRRG